VFADYDEIINAACQAWNRLINRPWKIMSIGMREWAHTGQYQ
ncbi:MAG: IS630 family transposase, partial [Rhodospirillales bacterium]|nr:IS630 family transposase [Rhodospirillales bacterium]MDP6574525.1 IS630 family transposase [Rhodospirillales bacterium]